MCIIFMHKYLSLKQVLATRKYEDSLDHAVKICLSTFHIQKDNEDAVS